MNSALKPVLSQPGVQPGGQSSPAKANVATANHSVALPQGANSLHHGSNSLVGQNLTQPAPAPPPPPHPVPSMAPVSANMAQMAQNMSHHGNLSHVSQNSVTPTNVAASPNKSATTSAPLSLVTQDKPQPLALTRTPDKKETDAAGQANGTVESPKSATNTPAALKPQNPEPNKDKQDIAKTSPSTPKPPEKPVAVSVPTTPQKTEPANPVSTTDGPSQPKVATANEAPEKSPSKPSEPKPAPTADVAPTQSDNKPAPEAANDNQVKEEVKEPEKAPTPPKVEAPVAESAKTEGAATPAKVEEKKEVTDKPAPSGEETKAEVVQEKKVEAQSEPVKIEEAEKPKPAEKVEEKKVETKAAMKETKVAAKSTLKLATVTPPMRKRRQASPKASEESPAKRAAEGHTTPDTRTKRNRTQVQLYQSPTPELTMATKLSASAGRSTPTRPNDDKLIVFYKNEYLAVRNAEGGFYVCQAMQNVYRATRKIKIRWLSQDKAADPSGETYKPDFYDTTDMECVLTTLSLQRAPSGGGAQILRATEAARARSILQRALRAEQGSSIELTEEHPDGLDLSLYTDESQLDKKGRKRTSSTRDSQPNTDAAKESPSPAKKARTTPKRSPKSARKTKATPPKQNNRKSPGSTPIVASTSKTATAVMEKAKAKTPKRTPTKSATKENKPVKEETVSTPTSTRKGRRSIATKVESKPAPAPQPSTSTGKATRTPRKPPAKK